MSLVPEMKAMVTFRGALQPRQSPARPLHDDGAVRAMDYVGAGLCAHGLDRKARRGIPRLAEKAVGRSMIALPVNDVQNQDLLESRRRDVRRPTLQLLPADGAAEPAC